ncbi:hypothetical protein D3C73_1384290 [compost metagenome]
MSRGVIPYGYAVSGAAAVLIVVHLKVEAYHTACRHGRYFNGCLNDITVLRQTGRRIDFAGGSGSVKALHVLKVNAVLGIIRIIQFGLPVVRIKEYFDGILLVGIAACIAEQRVLHHCVNIQMSAIPQKLGFGRGA